MKEKILKAVMSAAPIFIGALLGTGGTLGVQKATDTVQTPKIIQITPDCPVCPKCPELPPLELIIPR